MITPDAKCVVNGKKLNALISAVNPLLAAIKETLDVVDEGNQPGKRQFLIMKVDGAPDPSARQQLTADGSVGGDVDGGAGNQRDRLDAVGGGAASINSTGGAAPGDGGISVSQGQNTTSQPEDDSMNFEAGRRKLEELDKKKRQTSTQTFQMEQQTKERQAAADKMAESNRLRQLADEWKRQNR